MNCPPPHFRWTDSPASQQMQASGANRSIRRVVATTALLLAVTPAVADPLDPALATAIPAATQALIVAADVRGSVDEMDSASDALLVDETAIEVDGSTHRESNGDIADWQGGADMTFLDELVTQYFDGFN